ncbi:hypothetical protein P167DRAFT_580887 [Morchella conica CCBAS932]|uniref:Uncharacterized protein n=1 Tax=Morchella conica CCBAS932 TaxID=1392247 RepID=A0A3N4KAA4_9PEZI|nr:hypothetical protein P167DRAFT_580887 [Morchella conica CCBAS932]
MRIDAEVEREKVEARKASKETETPVQPQEGERPKSGDIETMSEVVSHGRMKAETEQRKPVADKGEQEKRRVGSQQKREEGLGVGGRVVFTE